MLENQIKDLTEAINSLTAAVLAINSPAVRRKAAPTEEEKKEVPLKAVLAEEEKKEVVTLDQLQDMCLTISRKDPTMREKIGEILAKHGGELLKNIDKTKLPSVKRALEELGAL